MAEKSNQEINAEFLIRKIIIEKQSINTEFNITSVINEVNIYEHVDKPYLTGQIVFADTNRIIETSEISGTELVTIEISTTLDNVDTIISKKFIITEIVQSVKSNDNTELVGISLIEDIGYYSRLLRVQKPYNGVPSSIINNILGEYLGRSVANIGSSEHTDGNMKVLVPNMTPIDAANWIKDRTSSATGLPYFLFSTICDDQLRFLDLEKILNLTPLNQFTYDYTFSQAIGSGFEAQDPRQFYAIRDFKYTNIEDQLMMARKGFTGSTYNFIDTIKNKSYTSRINAQETFGSIPYPPRQNLPIYDGTTSFPGGSMHNYDTSEISQLAPSKTFEDGSFNYYEASGTASHMFKAKSKSLRHFLHKSSIDISVPGKNFLHRGINKSVGNLINISFNSNISDTSNSSPDNNLDKKKSGAYMIYATRHVFQENVYNAVISCAKLGYKPRSAGGIT